MKEAKVVRLVTPDHLCPWEIKAWDLLNRNGYDIEDQHLTSSEENQRYKEHQDDFVHTMEGSDDMPSHLRMVLTRTSEVIPIESGRMALGTWQGIFLFEHRRAAHTRRITVNVTGE